MFSIPVAGATGSYVLRSAAPESNPVKGPGTTD